MVDSWQESHCATKLPNPGFRIALAQSAAPIPTISKVTGASQKAKGLQDTWSFRKLFGRQRDRDRIFSCWFTFQLLTVARAGGAGVAATSLNLHVGDRDPGTRVIPFCCLGCTATGRCSPKQSWDLNPGTQYEVQVPQSCILPAAKIPAGNTCIFRVLISISNTVGTKSHNSLKSKFFRSTNDLIFI